MRNFSLLSQILVVALLASSNMFLYREGPRYGKPVVESSHEVVLHWNQITLQAMSVPRYEWCCVRQRILAMTHLAMHDALNAITPIYQTYALERKDTKAHPVAAAATAAHTVLVASLPEQKAFLDSALKASLSNLPTGDKVNRGVSLGKQAGEKTLALREQDGAFEDPKGKIQIYNQPGAYQALPNYAFVESPFWKTMLPFSLQRPEQFRCPPQPALSSKAYSDDFNEVKSIGGKNSQTRTADQSFYAQFWYEASDIGWNRIARLVVEEKNTDLHATARLFALLNMALVDALTAGWDAKYYYNFWRPCTAIHAADKDENPATDADTQWVSFLETPPVQDYPSTHSALGKCSSNHIGIAARRQDRLYDELYDSRTRRYYPQLY